ncbi:MAG: hypothetical protein ACK5MN_08385, partial [Lachnospiraceae bacterium]
MYLKRSLVLLLSAVLIGGSAAPYTGATSLPTPVVAAQEAVENLPEDISEDISEDIQESSPKESTAEAIPTEEVPTVTAIPEVAATEAVPELTEPAALPSPAATPTVLSDAQDAVPYIGVDADGMPLATPQTQDGVEVYTGGATLDSGWYLVESDVTQSTRITVSGTHAAPT